MSHSPTRIPLTLATLALACMGALPLRASAADSSNLLQSGRFCSATGASLLDACRHAAQDAFFRAQAACINLDGVAAAECAARAERRRAQREHFCGAQSDARAGLCAAIGEARYQPGFDPADFQRDFHHPSPPNPYGPLVPGDRWRYKGQHQDDEITVLDATKLIAGVECVVVHDVVREGGVAIEDTEDWEALRNDGAVYYCGESSLDYATFAGDQPMRPELITISGSFKTGRHGDLPGLLVPIAPVVGAVYRQEFSPGNAEDAARILSVDYAYGRDAELDRDVPPALAQLLCAAGDCLVTEEFSPLEPRADERKYYARGIGMFLTVDLVAGTAQPLVQCNMDPRCDGLAALAGR
jgi:hypothetical protein